MLMVMFAYAALPITHLLSMIVSTFVTYLMLFSLVIDILIVLFRCEQFCSVTCSKNNESTDYKNAYTLVTEPISDRLSSSMLRCDLHVGVPLGYVRNHALYLYRQFSPGLGVGSHTIFSAWDRYVLYECVTMLPWLNCYVLCYYLIVGEKG